MVSKLKFKGDEPKKRKRRERDEVESSKSKKNSADVEGWVSAKDVLDLNGPLVIVLNDDSPVCICVDQEGKVYASNELDIVSPDNSKTFAHLVEPSFVQQVFVLIPVAFDDQKASDNSSTTSEKKYALKAVNGRYLGVEQDGSLSAKSAAIGRNQLFTLIYSDSGWLLRTSRDNYVSLRSKDDDYVITGDAESPGFTETFVLRVQAKNVINVSSGTSKDYAKVSSSELKARAGRDLTDQEVTLLKKANKEGKLNEALLDIRQKSKSDTRC